MQGLRHRWLTGALVGSGLAVALWAGIAYAADPRLDEADAACQKAIALLEAAENPGVNPPFAGHRQKAIKDLKEARKQIQKAKEFADKPPPPPKKKHHKD